MECIKCSAKLNDGAKFCKNCGQSQIQQSMQESDQSYNAQNEEMYQVPYVAKKSKAVVWLVAIIVVLVSTVAIGATAIFFVKDEQKAEISNKSEEVLQEFKDLEEVKDLSLDEALYNTFSNLENDIVKAFGNLPVIEHMQTMLTSSAKTVIKDTYDDITLYTDIQNDKLSVNLFDMLTVTTDGANVATSVVFLGDYGAEIDFKLSEVSKLTRVIKNTLIEEICDNVEDLDVKTQGEETITVGVSTYNAQKYSVKLSAQEINEIIKEVFYEVLTDDDIVELLINKFDVESIYQIFKLYDSENVKYNTFEALLESYAKEIKNKTFVYGNEVLELDFYVENGAIVKLVLAEENNPQNEVWVGIENPQNILEKIYFYDGYKTETVAVTENNGVFQIVCQSDKSSYSYGVTYDYNKGENNLVLFDGDYEDVLTINSQTENAIEISDEYKNLVIKSEIVAVNPSDFAIGSYINIKTSVDEVKNVIGEIFGLEFEINEQDFQSAQTTQNTNYEYIIYDSNVRYIEEAELKYLTVDDLAYARNEIFARHGHTFTTDKMKNYFGSKSWYIDRNLSISYANMNDYEIQNVETIKLEEALR